MIISKFTAKKAHIIVRILNVLIFLIAFSFLLAMLLGAILMVVDYFDEGLKNQFIGLLAFIIVLFLMTILVSACYSLYIGDKDDIFISKKLFTFKNVYTKTMQTFSFDEIDGYSRLLIDEAEDSDVYFVFLISGGEFIKRLYSLNYSSSLEGFMKHTQVKFLYDELGGEVGQVRLQLRILKMQVKNWVSRLNR